MLTTLTGIYQKSDNVNSIGIISNPVTINSPVLSKNINIDSIVISENTNTISEVNIYPSIVTINGIDYKESLTRNVNVNEYFYDNINREIIVSSILPVGSNVTISYYQNPIVESDIELLLGFPVLGARLSREWMDQPSGSITLAVPLKGLEEHLEALEPGSEFNWLGIGLVITSLSITHNPEFTKLGLLSVTLQLSGKWSTYLKPSQYASDKNTQITTIQEIAQRNGAVLEFPVYPVVVPRGKSTDSFDWASVLDNIAKTKYQYVYWSDSGSIKIRDIKTTSELNIVNPVGDIKVSQNSSYENHAQYQLKNDFVINDNGENYTTSLNTLDKIYYPYNKVPFIFDKATITSNIYYYSDGRVRNDYLEYLNGFTFKPGNRRIVKSITGSRSVPNFATGRVKDISIAPDITGYTQTYKETSTIDEKPFSELEETYGFLVNSDNINSTISSTWSIISQTVTTHIYDGLGYYLGYKKQGYKKERFSREDPKSPLTLNNEPDKTLYEWSTLPFTEVYSITLAPFYRYYIDTNALAGYYSIDDIYYPDPSFVEPYFSIYESKVTNSIVSIDNPENKNIKLTKGTETVNIKEIIPQSSISLPYAVSSSTFTQSYLQELLDKEGYFVHEQNFSSEGGQFNSSISSDSSEFISSKPSVAASLPPLLTKSETIIEENQKPPLLSKFYKSIIVRDAGYTGDSRGKTLSYPEASTLDEVKNCLYSDWITNNVRNGVTVDFTIQGLFNGYEGQCITLLADNIFYKGIVLSISYEIATSIESYQIKNLDSKTQIKIGLVPKDDPKNVVQIDFIKNNTVNTGKILYLGALQGTGLDSANLGRYSL